jgi:hypothetical protein
MKLKALIRYAFYTIIFGVAVYCLFKVINSFGVQYTEPEVIQTEQV